MSFDFCAFLRKLDPSVEYEFQSLSGGLINLTQRATKTSHSDAGKFPAQASLVLKYAPPFIAAIGEEAPFSQKRQVLKPLTVKSCLELSVEGYRSACNRSVHTPKRASLGARTVGLNFGPVGAPLRR